MPWLQANQHAAGAHSDSQISIMRFSVSKTSCIRQCLQFFGDCSVRQFAVVVTNCTILYWL